MSHCLVATVGRFSQRAHARPQGWFPVCAVTFFAIWRRVRRRVWRGCRPSLDFSSGFWAVPDPYYTIPGRNRADQLFFIVRQPDAFATPQEFQNGQNRPKSIKIPKFRFFSAGAVLQLCGSIRDTGNIFLMNSERFASGIVILPASEKEFLCFS